MDLPWFVGPHNALRATDALRLEATLLAFGWEESVGEAFEVVKWLVEEDRHVQIVMMSVLDQMTV